MSEAKLSKKDLAEKTGLHVSTIWRLLTPGSMVTPSTMSMLRNADIPRPKDLGGGGYINYLWLSETHEGAPPVEESPEERVVVHLGAMFSAQRWYKAVWRWLFQR
jgi:predicted DNA-binding transcriptional regulator AlpA